MTNRPQQFHETKAFLDTLLQVGMGPHDWWREKRTYAFRGQANATWPLVPKRFRPYAKGEAVPTVAQQAQREFQETKQFLGLADDHGLQIPEDNQQLRRTLAEPYGTPRDWPDPEFWSFLAVGQHYGFPTLTPIWSTVPVHPFAGGAGARAATHVPRACFMGSPRSECDGLFPPHGRDVARDETHVRSSFRAWKTLSWPRPPAHD